MEDGDNPEAIRSRILDHFGPRVLFIVESLTDSAAGVGVKPPWRQRKEAYVAHLAGITDKSVHRVVEPFAMRLHGSHHSIT